MRNPLTALYSTPDRMYVGPELAFQVITPRGQRVMRASDLATRYEEDTAKKSKISGLKIAIPAAGLAALVAVASLTETGRSVANQVLRSAGNMLDNAIYGQNVTGQKYTIIDYTIKPTDTSDTLREMVGNDPMAWDYIMIANGLNSKELRAGTIIKMPQQATQGKTLPELFAKFSPK